MEQQSPMKLWDITIEVLKNDMYIYKGMTINEVIEAEDEQKALEQLLRLNTIVNKNNISVLQSQEYKPKT